MVNPRNNPELTAEYVREHLSYDAETGIFRWISTRPGRKVGAVAGCRSVGGYWAIKLDGDLYKAHRLAWLYVHGCWPADYIDHIDENRSNNSIANLRVATPAQNAARRRTTRALGSSRGVFPQEGGFVARIHHAGKRHYLGFFTKAEDAKSAYERAAKDIHGEFAYSERQAPFPIHSAGTLSGAMSFGT